MEYCSKTPENFILFDNVILHVLILFIIVSALFVFLIAKITEHHINNEFLNIIDNLVDSNKLKEIILNKSSPNLKNIIAKQLNIIANDPAQLKFLETITKYISNMNDNDTEDLKKFLTNIINDYKTNDHKLRSETNKRVHHELIIIIGFLILIAIIINVIPLKMGNHCGVLKHLGIELLIIFTFVGIIEFWFFTNVASKYVPVKPTILIMSFKEKMNKLIN